MSKIRINDLARELEVKSKEILDTLTTVGVTEKKTHSSSLEDHEADLVRKHLRGRSDASLGSARPSSRTAPGEEEIKTKIDLSHISRPGDVLRAITQQKEAAEHPVARPAFKPPVTAPAIEGETEAGVRFVARARTTDAALAQPAAPTPPKAMPPKSASEAPAPPAPRMVTPASVAATYRPPPPPPRPSPPRSASEAPAPPAPRMVTPASVAATYRPPTVVVIPPRVPVPPPVASTPAAVSSATDTAGRN